MELINKINFGILVVSILIGVVFYDVIDTKFGFSYVDEIIILSCFLYWFKFGNYDKEFVVFGLISFFYLCYSLLFPHNVMAAIYMDFFIEIKPFVMFYCIYNLNMKITDRQAEYLKIICVVFAVLLLPVGLLSDRGHGFMEEWLCIHSRYATMMTVLGLVYYHYSSRENKDLIISTFIIAIGMLSFRSKSFAFFLAFVVVMYLMDNNHTKRIFSFSRVCLGILTIVLVYIVTQEKLLYYFIEGGVEAKNEMMARPAMYAAAFSILNDYPLFGTGFGSFANFSTRIYYSPLYSEYGIDHIWGLRRDLPVYVSDTFLAVFAQYGYIGISLFLLFWYKRCKDGFTLYTKTKNVYYLKMTLLFLFFFFVESVVDSTFIQNRGAVMMMLFAIVINKHKIRIARLNEIRNTIEMGRLYKY